MTKAEASADLGRCLREAAARGGEERRRGKGFFEERRRRRGAGRRDEPTALEEESVIGDGDDDDFEEGRGAIAAAGNLAPRSTREGFNTAAGLSVEAEAMAFILERSQGRLFKSREERVNALSLANEKKEKRANEVFRPVASAAPPGVAPPVPRARL